MEKKEGILKILKYQFYSLSEESQL